MPHVFYFVSRRKPVKFADMKLIESIVGEEYVVIA